MHLQLFFIIIFFSKEIKQKKNNKNMELTMILTGFLEDIIIMIIIEVSITFIQIIIIKKYK